VHCNP
ncbi:degT/DnrJ/EryC1/StrS aminotransferase family protein, partial [Vibrio parahaemolyticus V-223/04]